MTLHINSYAVLFSTITSFSISTACSLPASRSLFHYNKKLILKCYIFIIYFYTYILFVLLILTVVLESVKHLSAMVVSESVKKLVATKLDFLVDPIVLADFFVEPIAYELHEKKSSVFLFVQKPILKQLSIVSAYLITVFSNLPIRLMKKLIWISLAICLQKQQQLGVLACLLVVFVAAPFRVSTFHFLHLY